MERLFLPLRAVAHNIGWSGIKNTFPQRWLLHLLCIQYTILSRACQVVIW